MGMFDLPSRWVYVEYKSGKRENVANTDTLSEKEAEEFKQMWEKREPVTAVTLETSSGKILKRYDFSR